MKFNGRRVVSLAACAVAIAAALGPATFAPSAWALAAAPTIASHPAWPAPASSGVVIVKRRGGSHTAMRASVAGTEALGPHSTQHGVTAVAVPDGVPAATYAALLAADPAVEYAEPDYIRQPLGYTSTPSDPDFQDPGKWNCNGNRYYNGKSWGLRMSGFDAVWPALAADGDAVPYHARSTSASFTVGVIDTGFYFNHPDAGANIVAGYDVFDSFSLTGGLVGDSNPSPVDLRAPGNSESFAAHGTCVAGEIAALADNGLGSAGATFDGTVRVYKVSGTWPEGCAEAGVPAGGVVILSQAIVEAIYRATDDGCRVINLSVGSCEFSQAEQDAIDYAYARGVLVVAASGNDGSGHIAYPAGCDHVLAVGALDMNGLDGAVKRADFSSYGPGLDVVAPGVMIWGLARPGYDADGDGAIAKPGYDFWSGTSMAGPLVASAASLLWRTMPQLSPDEVSAYLCRTARDVGPVGYDELTGWGSVDIAAARAAVIADYPALAPPTIAAPSCIASHTVDVSWNAVAGYSATYDLTVDGAAEMTGTTERVARLALAEGPHSVTVVARSPRNWSGPGISASTATVLVDTQAPGAPGMSFEEPVVAIVDGESGAHAHEYRLDGGSAVPANAERIELPRTLAEGPHTIAVRVIDAAGNVGPWAELGFEWLAYPDAPRFSAGPGMTSATSVQVSWAATPRAEAYELRLNGGEPVRVDGTSATAGPLGAGANTVSVRAMRGTLESEWTTMAVRVRAATISVDRLSGRDRYEVSYAVSRATYDRATVAVLVTGENWPDALSSGVLARAMAGPVLLTRTKSLSPGAVAEMRRLGVREVIVVGGEASVSARVFARLGALGFSARRIAGRDRYTTAALVADAVVVADGGAVPGGVAFVASGERFCDALLASSVAARLGQPVLLTRRRGLPAETAARFSALKVAETVVVGDPSLVPDAQLAAMPGATRVSGKSPCEASMRFAEWAVARTGADFGHVFLASCGASKYGDSLTGGPLVASRDGVLLFVPGDIGPQADACLRGARDQVVAAHLLGGEASVYPAVAVAVQSMR